MTRGRNGGSTQGRELEHKDTINQTKGTRKERRTQGTTTRENQNYDNDGKTEEQMRHKKEVGTHKRRETHKRARTNEHRERMK